MNFDPNKPIVTLTETAAFHVRRLMDSADNDVIGVRVGVGVPHPLERCHVRMSSSVEHRGALEKVGG